MIDESHRSRLASALEQDSPELALSDLAQALKAEGLPLSGMVELYHEFLLQHIDDVDATKHQAIRKVLQKIRGVTDVDAGLRRQRIPRKRPWCGIMAVSAPLLGFIVAIAVARRMYVLYGEHGGLGAVALTFFSALCVLMLGGVAAIAALLRGEKYRALGWVGLVVNFGPVLLSLLYHFTHK